MSIVVINFDGEIEDFPVLIQTVDNLIAGGAHRLVLDLGSLPFVNSAALGYLIKVQKVMGQHDGEMVLASLKPAVRNILEMTEMDALIPAFDTVEEATDYLGRDREVRHHAWR